jgi:hypothetical protein
MLDDLYEEAMENSMNGQTKEKISVKEAIKRQQERNSKPIGFNSFGKK